jgi:hypothetical protein
MKKPRIDPIIPPTIEMPDVIAKIAELDAIEFTGGELGVGKVLGVEVIVVMAVVVAVGVAVGNVLGAELNTAI